MSINKQSGIYKITNLVNNKIYIGSSTNLDKRKYEHFYDLKLNKHHSKYLQNSYNKHGVDNFKFETLAYCPSEYRIKLEQWFMDNLNPAFNILKLAASPLGRKHTEETKNKMSVIRIGKVQTQETINKRLLSINNPVLQFDKDNNFIAKYKSASEAGRLLNINIGAIVSCCNNKLRWYKNFIWKYENKKPISLEAPKLKDQRKVKVTFPNGKIEIYNSPIETSKKLKIHKSGICACLINTQKTSHGYSFKYID